MNFTDAQCQELARKILMHVEDGILPCEPVGINIMHEFKPPYDNELLLAAERFGSSKMKAAKYVGVTRKGLQRRLREIRRDGSSRRPQPFLLSTLLNRLARGDTIAIISKDTEFHQAWICRLMCNLFQVMRMRHESPFPDPSPETNGSPGAAGTVGLRRVMTAADQSIGAELSRQAARDVWAALSGGNNGDGLTGDQILGDVHQGMHDRVYTADLGEVERRVLAQYMIHGTTSGRVSSIGGNTQSLPRGAEGNSPGGGDMQQGRPGRSAREVIGDLVRQRFIQGYLRSGEMRERAYDELIRNLETSLMREIDRLRAELNHMPTEGTVQVSSGGATTTHRVVFTTPPVASDDRVYRQWTDAASGHIMSSVYRALDSWQTSVTPNTWVTLGNISECDYDTDPETGHHTNVDD